MQLTNIENSGQTDEKHLNAYFKNIKDSEFLLQIRNDYLKVLQDIKNTLRTFIWM